MKWSEFKILTETSKTPLTRALALASFLGSDYPTNLGARTAPPAKDLMAFGSVLAHNQNQHNIGESLSMRRLQIQSNFSLTCRIVLFLQNLHFYTSSSYARRWKKNYKNLWVKSVKNWWIVVDFVVCGVSKVENKRVLKTNFASRHEIIAIFLSFYFNHNDVWCFEWW